MKIAFLGHGELGSAFRTTLKAADPRLRAVAHDRDPAARAGVMACGLDGLGSADWVLCAVGPEEALAAAGQAAPHMREGQVYVDANGVAPATKQRAAEALAASGAAYLDMAVLGRVLPLGHRTPVLVSGAVEAARADLDRLGFDWRPAGEGAEGRPGAAAAVETIRALWVRGVEALTVETLLAAGAAGCLPQVLGALEGRGLDLGAFASVAQSGARHAAEMDESAATVQALGLNGGLAAQVAAVQRRSAGGPEEGGAEALVAAALARLR